MEPKDLRMRCPECSWSVVVGPEHTEDELSKLPEGVTKRINGVFYCPNPHGGVDVGLVPVASVPRDYSPKIQNADAMSKEDWQAKLGELEVDVEKAEARVKRAAEGLKDAKDEREARLITLRTALRRFTHGAPEEESKPLLDIAEGEVCGARDGVHVCGLQPGHAGDHAEDIDGVTCETWPQQGPVCNAEYPGGPYVCNLEPGHEGNHIDSTGRSNDGQVASWPQTAIEQAAAVDSNEAHASMIKLVERFEQFEIPVTAAMLTEWTAEEYGQALDYLLALEEPVDGETPVSPDHVPAKVEKVRHISHRGTRKKRGMPTPESEPETVSAEA